MKVVKGLAILSFFSIVFGSCFDPPEFPDVPQIVFKDIAFCDVTDNSKPDSLILTIEFKDGDGDLGLDANSAKYRVEPFHYADFYQNIAGSFQEIPVEIGQMTGPGGAMRFVDFFDIPNPTAGELVFPRTRNNPNYTGMLPPYSCADYEYREFVIHISDSAVLDRHSKIADTLQNESGIFYLVQDTLFLEPNPNHFNIEVDFLVKDPSNPSQFTEYDWRKERCTTYDGRFPFLTESDNALDGTLKYNMESRGFKILFGGKTIKLRIKVRDRALHTSNIIETPEFTLDGIRRCGS